MASYLQVQSVWESSRGRQRQLDEIKERFAVAEGDAVTALNVHAAWCKAGAPQVGDARTPLRRRTCSPAERWFERATFANSWPGTFDASASSRRLPGEITRPCVGR